MEKKIASDILSTLNESAFVVDKMLGDIKSSCPDEELRVCARFFHAFTFSDMEDETGSAAAVERTFAEAEILRQASRAFVCKYAWGALAMAISTTLFNSVESTIPRIDGGFLVGLERAYGPDSEQFDPSFGAKT